MHVDTFLTLNFSDVNLEDATRVYADWMLGVGDERVRRRRLEQGIRPEWTTELLLGGGTFVGDHGLRFDVRAAEDRMSVLVRLIHRDADDPAVFWHSVGRLRGSHRSLVVDHAAGRDAPRNFLLDPIGAAPRPVLQLLDLGTLATEQRELVQELVTLRAHQVAGFVAHVLLRRERTVPVVIIASESRSEQALVDPVVLSQRLRGFASVAHLPDDAASFALSDALEARGLSRMLRCFDGAIHSYGRAADLATDHRLWLGDNVATVDRANREVRIAGTISRRLATRILPPGFFLVVEEFDREERQRSARALVKKSVPPSASMSSRLAELEEHATHLQSQLNKELAEQDRLLAELIRAEEARNEAERLRDEAEARAEEQRAFARELQTTLERSKRAGREAGLSGETGEAILAALADRPTPRQALLVLTALYPGRVVVLPTAWRSAEASAGYRHPGQAFDLLRKLFDQYWSALSQGLSDAQIAVFGKNEYAAKESETTMGNKDARRLRTFQHNGKDVVMWRHLKLGNKDSASESLRVHFEWFADEKAIVIGHCGPHLDLR